MVRVWDHGEATRRGQAGARYDGEVTRLARQGREVTVQRGSDGIGQAVTFMRVVAAQCWRDCAGVTGIEDQQHALGFQRFEPGQQRLLAYAGSTGHFAAGSACIEAGQVVAAIVAVKTVAAVEQQHRVASCSMSGELVERIENRVAGRFLGS